MKNVLPIYFYFALCFSALTTIASVPNPDLTLQLNPANGYNIVYGGTTFTATAYILYSNSQNHQIRKPFLVCDGFDPGDKRDYYTTAGSDDTRGLYQILNGDSKDGSNSVNVIPQLLALCYDVIIINWHQGAGFIEGNAKLYEQFIQYVNSINTTNEKLVMVGPSMGGLITRFALAEMEHNGIDAHARLFISFDTPHTGAVIPLGIQHLLQDLVTLPGADDAMDALSQLNSDAAKEMLLSHYSSTGGIYDNGFNPSPHPYRQSMLANLNALGNNGYPRNVRMIAISNGDGKSSQFPLGQQLVDFVAKYVGPFLTGRAYAFGRSDQAIYDGNVVTASGSVARHIINNTQNCFDACPGGVLDVPYFINHNNFNASTIASTLPTTSCFIPTASAFGLSLTTTNLFLDWKNPFLTADHNYYRFLTPFDDVMVQQTNQFHITITSAIGSWLLNEITYGVSNQDSYDYNAWRPGQGTSPEFIQAKDITYRPMTSTPNVTFISGQEVLLRASSFMLFEPGVEVEAGTNLIAEITSTNLSCIQNGMSRWVKPPEKNNLPTSEMENPQTLKNNFWVSQNPNNGYFSLIVNPEQFAPGKINLSVYDTYGKLIYESNIINLESQIDLSMFSKGLYFVKVMDGNGAVNIKKIIYQ